MSKLHKVYPDISEEALKAVSIPVLPTELRLEYARPETLRIYVPDDLKDDSDEDNIKEQQRKEIVIKYKHKRIDRVAKKFKNSTGQVKYYVYWVDGTQEEVPSKALQDHIDWDLVEHFEYQQAIKNDK